MIRFGVVGGGWRSEFYIRIATLLPQRFELTGVYIRNPQVAITLSDKYNIITYSSLEHLINTNPDFIVSCVDKYSICSEIELLCERGIAVLSETPIGINHEQIKDFKKKVRPEWKIQVAEQFHFQPRNQAYKKIIESGVLGTVHQVYLSCCHDYHAVRLFKYFLDIKEEKPKIQSLCLPDKVIRYNSRNGVITPKVVSGKQKIAVIRYGNKTAIYDFNVEQYFSAIRSSYIRIKGTKGEIVNDSCTYLNGSTPMRFDLTRNMCGSNENLDGLYLDSITGNSEVLYTNPFNTARLTDEEIAVSMCIEKMKNYLMTGEDFYSLSDAINDAEISLKISTKTQL